ncbi:unnamed protein product (macronuclear) [Paramecium tetraurelia]|uniref:Uncharacterized protein n=1 Tax=Paramecium tetraurelia TaxID=5888 RepID=A0CM04_PARTE|nr:uncharacterized protein GSPATT00008300001 [Paramecium tetraurelia]CAK71821.1 unnamed protein product [Paramecium tetraurelia]|eukprot:XP_001439218.1 hypothetical protein (macronuclear) [Paramecium tetraurelia strain d4-2]
MQIEAESNINIQEIYESMVSQQFNIAILRQWEKEWLLENYLFPQIKNNEQYLQNNKQIIKRACIYYNSDFKFKIA